MLIEMMMKSNSLVMKGKSVKWRGTIKRDFKRFRRWRKRVK